MIANWLVRLYGIHFIQTQITNRPTFFPE